MEIETDICSAIYYIILQKTIFLYARLETGPYYVIGCGCPQRFPHNNFSSVYRIFTRLGHMIPL
jgi:hypothetical protein